MRLRTLRDDKSILPEALAWAALWLAWLAWFYWKWPLWEDHAVYQLMAANWLEGGSPYVDVVDANWPGAMWLHAMVFALGGYAGWGVRVLDAALEIWLGVLTFRVLAAYGVARLWRVVAMALFAMCYLMGLYGETAQRESLALPFLIFGLFPWLLPVREVRAWPWWRIAFWHGLSLGFAICIKPTLGAVMIAVGLASLACTEVRWREWLRWIAEAAFGGFLMLALMAWSLHRTGSWDGFVSWGVRYAFCEYGRGVEPWLERLWNLARWQLVLGGWTSVGLICALYVWCKKGHRSSPALMLWLALIAGFLFGALAQGRTYCLYHFVPIFYGVAVLAAFLTHQSGIALSSRARWIGYSSLLLLLAVWSVIHSVKSNAPTSAYTLGKELRRELKPNQNVVTLGFMPTFYLALEKTAPYPLVNGLLFYCGDESRQIHEEDRLLRALADPRTRFCIVDGVVMKTPWVGTRLEKRPRVAEILQRDFRDAGIRTVLGNPLECAEPVEYRLYERR